VIDVGILDKTGIADVPAGASVKKLPNIGRREATQITDTGGAGSCTIIVGVTKSSRVDIGVIAGTDTQKACELTMQVAQLVEPELP
jgi:hypothetical protein